MSKAHFDDWQSRVFAVMTTVTSKLVFVTVVCTYLVSLS